MEPLLKSGITLAAFHSMGTEPDCKDKFIMSANGLVIIVAASFNIPGGRLSRPVDLFLLRFLSPLKTSSSETELKTKCSGGVVSRELTGLPETKLQSGKLLVFRTPAIVEKKSQKPWAMEDVFEVLVPFRFIAAAEPVVIFVGYNFLIADQNLPGEEALI